MNSIIEKYANGEIIEYHQGEPYRVVRVFPLKEGKKSLASFTALIHTSKTIDYGKETDFHFGR